MDDLTALLAAIIENPEADVPRLMYADALIERDGPGDAERAKSIRRGVEGRERVWPETFGPWSHRMSQFDGDPVLPPDVLGIYHRGFYETIETDAATFLRHADELLWHRGQTVACGRCGLQRVLNPNLKTPRDVSGCTLCGGTGRVPRPCPPTAQPITTVVLTGCDDWGTFLTDNDFSVVNTTGVRGAGKWSSPRWPGVEFELPRGTEAVSDDGDAMNPVPYDDPYPDVPWGGGL